MNMNIENITPREVELLMEALDQYSVQPNLILMSKIMSEGQGLTKVQAEAKLPEFQKEILADKRKREVEVMRLRLKLYEVSSRAAEFAVDPTPEAPAAGS